MEKEIDYVEINRALWNERTKHHVHSNFYDVEGFMSGQTSLKGTELSLLGNVTEKQSIIFNAISGRILYRLQDWVQQ